MYCAGLFFFSVLRCSLDLEITLRDQLLYDRYRNILCCWKDNGSYK